MNPLDIKGRTRALGAPLDWTPETSGECGVLAIRDEMHGGMPCMVSAWRPTAEELVDLNRGAPVYLRVVGTIHPPVAVLVERTEVDAAADEMLATLKGIDAFWSEDGANPDEEQWTDGMRANWLRIRAAIAKAEGQS